MLSFYGGKFISFVLSLSYLENKTWLRVMRFSSLSSSRSFIGVIIRFITILIIFHIWYKIEVNVNLFFTLFAVIQKIFIGKIVSQLSCLCIIVLPQLSSLFIIIENPPYVCMCIVWFCVLAWHKPESTEEEASIEEMPPWDQL